MGNQVKHPLIILISFLLLSSPLFGQSERPETIIIPVSGIGDVSNTRKLILENTLTDELKKHFRIVPQEKYEQVLEVKNSNQNIKVMLRMVFQMVLVF